MAEGGARGLSTQRREQSSRPPPSGGGWTWDNTAHEDYPKEDFVYHAAGLAGYGSSSYIDGVILRDADSNTDWDAASDGTLEERTYTCQNWRADVVALATDAGQLIQQMRYDPYGVPFGISKADVNGDGVVNSQDYLLFGNLWNGGTHPYADWNFDGVVNTTDYSAFLNSYSTDTALGRGTLGYDETVAGGNGRKGYAGYEINPELVNEDTGTGKAWLGWYHVRHRVYASHLGRWTRRDPLGYVEGPSLYTMGWGMPLIGSDPTGTAYGSGSGCGGGGGGGGGSYGPRGGCSGGGGGTMWNATIAPALLLPTDDLDPQLAIECFKLLVKYVQSYAILKESCEGVTDSGVQKRVQQYDRHYEKVVQQVGTGIKVPADMLQLMLKSWADGITANMLKLLADGIPARNLDDMLQIADDYKKLQDLLGFAAAWIVNPAVVGIELQNLRDAIEQGDLAQIIGSSSGITLGATEMGLEIAKLLNARAFASGGLKMLSRAVPIAGWVSLGGELAIGAYTHHKKNQIKEATQRAGNRYRCDSQLVVHEAVHNRIVEMCVYPLLPDE